MYSEFLPMNINMLIWEYNIRSNHTQVLL